MLKEKTKSINIDEFQSRKWNKETKKYDYHLSLSQSVNQRCLGINDFNEKLIFEGDVIKDINFPDLLQKVVYNKNECKFEFITIKTGFSFIKTNGKYSCKYMEVIGTIDKNPELLKE